MSFKLLSTKKTIFSATQRINACPCSFWLAYVPCNVQKLYFFSLIFVSCHALFFPNLFNFTVWTSLRTRSNTIRQVVLHLCELFFTTYTLFLSNPLQKISQFYIISWCRSFVKRTVFAEFRTSRWKLCGRCAFSQNFHNRQLGEVFVFFTAVFASCCLSIFRYLVFWCQIFQGVFFNLDLLDQAYYFKLEYKVRFYLRFQDFLIVAA